ARLHHAAARARSQGAQSGVQHRTHRGKLPDPRRRGDRAPDRAEDHHRVRSGRLARSAQLPGQLRSHRARAARIPAALDGAARRRGSLPGHSGVGPAPRRLRRPPLQPDRLPEATARRGTGDRRPALGRSRRGRSGVRSGVPAMALYHRESACRVCGGADLVEILALGNSPLADRLLTPDQLTAPDVTVPLTLMACPACSLVQIAETVDPEVLFGGDYPYFSSVSGTLLRHSRANAEELIARLGLGADSLVVEIASNDGYMLKNFVARGIPVLGIDPASAPAAAAIEARVPTLVDFFGRALAEQLKAEGRSADLIIANNVLAHVADLNGLVAGIAVLLKQDGVAVLEMPYVVDLIEHCEFDTIYHQHLCYFSVTALDHLFRRHGLSLNDV